MYSLYKVINIVDDIKIKTLEWETHHKTRRRKNLKNILYGKFHNTRSVGKPRKIWKDVVQRNALQVLEIRGWRRRGSFWGTTGPRWGCNAIRGSMQYMPCFIIYLYNFTYFGFHYIRFSLSLIYQLPLRHTLCTVLYRMISTAFTTYFMYCTVRDDINCLYDVLYVLYCTGWYQLPLRHTLCTVLYRMISTAFTTYFMYCTVQDDINCLYDVLYVLYCTGWYQLPLRRTLCTVLYRMISTAFTTYFMYCTVQDDINCLYDILYVLYCTGWY
jgi:hypothetical protein